MQQRFLTPLLLASLVGLHGVVSAQTTLEVPSQYSTIQAAINASVDGDTVLVAPGTYYEDEVDFLGKEITVRSTGGVQVTRIDAQNSDRVLHFLGGETENTVLDGFQIWRGFAGNASSGNPGPSGGAALIRGSSPTIRNCRFYASRAGTGSTGRRGGRAGAVYIYDGASPRIENCHFTFNTAGTGGIGATGYTGADGTFAGVPGDPGGPGGDGGDGGHGGAIYVSNSSVVILNSVFTDNGAGQGGTGGRGGTGGDGETFLGAYVSNGGDGGRGGQGGESGSGSAIYVDGSSVATLVNVSCGYNVCTDGGARGPGGSGGDGFSDGDNGLLGDRGSEGSLAIRVGVGGHVAVHNSILWGNDDQRQDFQIADATVSYSIVEKGYSGEGNLDVHPAWDADTSYSNWGVLSVQDGSPAIDAGGTPIYMDEFSTDLEGKPRFFDHPSYGGGIGTPDEIDMGAYEFADAFALPFGCNVNAADSFDIVAGEASLGETITFGIDNPTGGQSAGAIPALLYSMERQLGCGILMPGFGMGAGDDGAILLGLDDLAGILGTPWPGPGEYALVDAPIPNASEMIGVSIYVQGVLVGGGGIGLSRGLQLIVGP